MQKKNGERARGVTTEEWRDFMLELRAAVYGTLADEKKHAEWEQRTGGTVIACPPLYSFDNPTIHTDPATLWELQIIPNLTRLELPPRSPDLHKVIEHSHAVICQRFQQWVNETSETWEMPGYCNVLRHLFYTKLTPTGIRKDVESLDKTFQAVVERGGERAPAAVS